MMPAYITRLITFAQHGEPKGYAASDMMRADLEGLLVGSATRLKELENVLRNLSNTFHEGRAVAVDPGSESYVMSCVDAAERVLAGSAEDAGVPGTSNDQQEKSNG